MTQEPLTPHRAVAERMRALRTGRGWSAQKLAEEMSKIGIKWDRSIVANLEYGRRHTVSVEEWLALAFVLSVAPIHLLVPTVGEEDMTLYALTPSTNSVPAYVRAWIRGQTPVGGQDPRRYFSEVPEAEWQPPQMSTEYVEKWGAAYDRSREDGHGER